MKAINTPIRSCFSKDDMQGSYYHEHYEDNREPHSFHRYDADGNYVKDSMVGLSKMSTSNEFYLSDRKGNKLEKMAS